MQLGCPLPTQVALTRATSSTTLTIVADPTDISGSGQVVVKNVVYPRFLGRKVAAPPPAQAAAEKEYADERRLALKKRRAGAGRKDQGGGGRASRNQASHKAKHRKVLPVPQ